MSGLVPSIEVLNSATTDHWAGNVGTINQSAETRGIVQVCVRGAAQLLGVSMWEAEEWARTQLMDSGVSAHEGSVEGVDRIRDALYVLDAISVIGRGIDRPSPNRSGGVRVKHVLPVPTHRFTELASTLGKNLNLCEGVGGITYVYDQDGEGERLTLSADGLDGRTLATGGLGTMARPEGVTIFSPRGVLRSDAVIGGRFFVAERDGAGEGPSTGLGRWAAALQTYIINTRHETRHP